MLQYQNTSFGSGGRRPLLSSGSWGPCVSGPAGVKRKCLRRWSPVIFENRSDGLFVAPEVRAALGAASKLVFKSAA